MKAFLYREPATPWMLEDVPTPSPGPREVLIKVAAAGVCGSDLHYRYGRAKPKGVPLISGHEIAGTVAALGEGAQGVALGDRVCVHYISSCARCPQCGAGNDNRCRSRRSIGTHLPGGYAEYLVVPDRNAIRLPDSVPMELGAILGCAVSTAYHAVRFGELRPGETVAVFGLGGVGMHVVACAKAFGAARVIAVDVRDEMLKLAPAFGADVVLHSERDRPVEAIRALTDGYGADMALDCCGAPSAMLASIECVHGKSVYESGRWIGVALSRGGIALPEPWSFREGRLARAGDHSRNDLLQTIRLVETGVLDLSRSVTHRFPFERLEEAMAAVEHRQEAIVRAVVTMEK